MVSEHEEASRLEEARRLAVASHMEACEWEVAPQKEEAHKKEASHKEEVHKKEVSHKEEAHILVAFGMVVDKWEVARRQVVAHRVDVGIPVAPPKEEGYKWEARSSSLRWPE